MHLACCLPKLHFLFFPEKTSKDPRLFQGQGPKPRDPPKTHQHAQATP